MKNKKKEIIINTIFWLFFLTTLCLSIWYSTIDQSSANKTETEFSQIWNKFGNFLVFFNVPIFFFKTKSIIKSLSLNKKINEQKQKHIYLKQSQKENYIKQRIIDQNKINKVKKSSETKIHNNIKSFCNKNFDINLSDEAIYLIIVELKKEYTNYYEISNIIFKDTNQKPPLDSLYKLKEII